MLRSCASPCPCYRKCFRIWGRRGWGTSDCLAGLLGLWPRLTSGPCVLCVCRSGASALSPSSRGRAVCRGLGELWRTTPVSGSLLSRGKVHREETTWPPPFSHLRAGEILGAQLWVLDSGFVVSAGGPLLTGLRGRWGGLRAAGAVRVATVERVRGPCLALAGTSKFMQRETE